MKGPSAIDLARAFGDSTYPLEEETDVPRRRKTNLPRGPRSVVGRGPGALACDDRPTPPDPPRPVGARGPVLF